MSTSNSNISNLSLLQQLYPNVLLLNTLQVATVLGIAVKTINTSKNFPLRPGRLCGKKFQITDVARLMDSSFGITTVNNPAAATEESSPGTPGVPSLPSIANDAKDIKEPTAIAAKVKRGRGRPPTAKAAK